MPQYELNFRDYVRIINKRKFIIVLVCLASIVSSFFYPTPEPQVIYRASTVIRIAMRKTLVGMFTEQMVFNPGDYLESEIKLIESFAILKKVALRLNKIKENSSEQEISAAIKALDASINIERVSSTNLVRITTISSTAQEAMDLANMVAEVYIQQDLIDKVEEATRTKKFIEKQLTILESRVSKIEERLKQFSDQEKSLKLSEPLHQQLISLETELAELEQRYTDKYPRVIELKQKIKILESQIQTSGSSTQQELEYIRSKRELEVNTGLYENFRQKLEEARISEAQKVSDISVVNPADLPTPSTTSGKINNKMRAGIAAFMGLVIGAALAFLLESMDTSIATIEEVEGLVKLPVLGVIPSFVAEFKHRGNILTKLKNTLRSPKAKSDEEERLMHLIAHYKPHSSIAEAFKNLQTNLRLDPGKKTLLVTSSNPSEGKTAVVCNLGIVMAQLGFRTVLLSTDLRRPLISKVFGIKREPGLAEFLIKAVDLDSVLNDITDVMLGEIKIEDLMKTPGLENIWMIQCGRPPENPVELLKSKDFDSLIATLKQRFDIIILDSPPVLAVTDANILASKVDSVVLVYEIGRTRREALIRARVQLESVGAKISGVILNNTHPQSESLSSYPYYSYKYKYYTIDRQDDT